MSTKNAVEGIEHRFLAALYSCGTDSQGNHLATFYLMNTSRNRNRWGVTDQSLAEALPTLKGVAIGMGKDYQVDKHYPDGQTMDSGAFNGYEKPGSYVLGTAKITDEKTWSMMQKGEIGPVSVVVRSFRDTCSSCGQDLSGLKDPFGEHKCLKEGDAYARVESFRFKRVDFVDVPAYPQAGLLEMASNTENKSVPLELLAGFYVSQGFGSEERPRKVDTQIQEVKKLSEKENERLASLEQANAKLTLDLAAAVAKAGAFEGSVKELKAQLDAMQKEKHDAFVGEVYDARSKAGISGKPEEEKTMLAKLSDETLLVMKGDALKVAQFTQTQDSPAPKTRYAKQTEDSLEAAVKDMRAKMGFPDKAKEVS